jgi:hypothetical protein
VAAPTLTSQASSSWADQASPPEVTGTLTWNAGDRILVVALTEDSTITLATPTATGLTFTALGTEQAVTDSCWAHAWQATAAASGSSAITAAAAAGSATNTRDLAAFAWGGCTGFVRTNGATPGAAQTVSVTRTQANSAVVFASADWSAGGVAGLGWTPAGQTQLQAAASAGATGLLAYWGDQGATGTTSYGTTGLAGTVYTALAVEVLGTAGSAITRTVTDTTGAADTTTAARVIGRTQSDPAAAADTTTTTAVFARTQSDPAATADTRALAQTTTPADTAGLTDAGTTLARAAIGTDICGVTDAVSTQLATGSTAFTRTIDDPAGTADTAQLLLSRTVTDSAGAADAGVTRTLLASGADPAGLTDTATPALTTGGGGGSVLTRTVDDPAGLADGRALAVAVTVSDLCTLVDAGRTQARTAAATEPAGLTDTVQAQLLFAGLTRTVTDAAGLTDVDQPLTVDLGEILADTAGLADTAVAVVSAAGSTSRTVDDPAGLGDSRALARTLTTADITGLTDTGRTQGQAAQGVDTLGLADTVQAVLSTTNIVRTLTDLLGLLDAGDPMSVDVLDVPVDLVGLSDAVSADLSGSGLVTRTVTDAAALSDQAAPAAGYTRALADTTGTTDTAATAVNSSGQSLLDGLGLVDAVTLAVVAARAAGDALGLADTVVAALTRSVVITDPAGLTDTAATVVTPVLAHVRDITDVVVLTSLHRLRETTVRPYAGVISRYPLVPD